MTIVNFSTKEYRAGQRRLGQSLWGTNTKELFFSSYEEIGSPTHQQSPYEFKIHSIEKALQKDDICLWCDSSLWRVGDISVIEDIIIKDGYFLEEAGHYVSDWCNAETRQYFNLTETGFLMFSAGLVGLNRHSEIAMDFFKQWKEAALNGCFRGDWSNHRHDMTAGSIIAQRLKMKYQRGGSHLSYIGPGYSRPEPSTIFYLQGL